MRDLEARDNWIAARVDELMGDDDFLGEWAELSINITTRAYATQVAEREHAAIMADLEEAIIDSMELK